LELSSDEERHRDSESCNHGKIGLHIDDPILTEDDVPGAKIAVLCARNYKVEELKRWLLSRDLPIGGRKDELVERYDCGLIIFFSHSYPPPPKKNRRN